MAAVRRISEAPSARYLKPRRLSAVRRWPPRCGRLASRVITNTDTSTDTNTDTNINSSIAPPPPTEPVALAGTPLTPNTDADAPLTPTDTPNSDAPLTPSDVPNTDALLTPNIDAPLLASNTDAPPLTPTDTPNTDTPPPPPPPLPSHIPHPSTSTFFPPPKRQRSLSVVRRYPPGCGRTTTAPLVPNQPSPDNPPQIAQPQLHPNSPPPPVSPVSSDQPPCQPQLSPDQPPCQPQSSPDRPPCQPLSSPDQPPCQPQSEQLLPTNHATSPARSSFNLHSRPSKGVVIALQAVHQLHNPAISNALFNQKILARKNATPVPPQMPDHHHHDHTLPPQKDTSLLVAVLPQPSPARGKTKKKGRRVAKKTTLPTADDFQSTHPPNLMTLTLLPLAPSDGGDKLSNARGKVKKILRLFQTVCRVLLQKEESVSSKQPPKDKTGSESKSKAANRIDLRAADIVKRSSEYVDPGNPVVGHLPGVEVGDEFRYRVELHLIGLHRPLQSGIDWTKVNGVPVATSIVASGGYSDGMDGSDVLIYTGSGGKPTGRKGQRIKPEDQKLEKGNLALKNSMDMKTPVRVIHGLNTSDTRKVVMTFTYDGLYMVDEFKQEPEKYKIDGQEYTVQVFKFKLRRMVGQPELGLHVATKTKKSAVREGLCVPDISLGKEKIPICVINTIDNEKPPPFEYVTSIKYPSWYEKTAPKGCDCTNKCSSSKRCLCALKNGGEIPFNFNGAIVQAKTLIYECGPSCGCPPSCHNRVSQSGIKVPLEIFKTETRGWGVRSLSSIQSGSFVCEYVGELLRDEEAERRGNDEYLFDIGHNYDDAALWEGLPSFVPGIGSTCADDTTDSVSEGFTIDAAVMGNVGRFINHSCSPNLYAQNVLFDHDDRRMPHIMFFAAENIPPLQELTYHYNYTIGEVRDSQGNEKVKRCYCGSLECEGRLY